MSASGEKLSSYNSSCRRPEQISRCKEFLALKTFTGVPIPESTAPLFYRMPALSTPLCTAQGTQFSSRCVSSPQYNLYQLLINSKDAFFSIYNAHLISLPEWNKAMPHITPVCSNTVPICNTRFPFAVLCSFHTYFFLILIDIQNTLLRKFCKEVPLQDSLVFSFIGKNPHCLCLQTNCYILIFDKK